MRLTGTLPQRRAAQSGAPTRRVLVAAVAAAILLVGCGDEEAADVSGSETAEVAASTTEVTATTETTEVTSATEVTATTEIIDVTSTTEVTSTSGVSPPPAYEFGVQPDHIGFAPAACCEADAGEEITNFVYPGQTVPLLFIETDPGGDACPTNATLELTNADGEIVRIVAGATELEIPGDATGTLTVTATCERNGEPGVGVVELQVAALLSGLAVSEVSVLAGGSLAVELEGGCPAGAGGVLGITPADGPFAVMNEPVPLMPDGTGSLEIPEFFPAGTHYATVQCLDGDVLVALAFTQFEVTEG
jgi:hypothetical protein